MIESFVVSNLICSSKIEEILEEKIRSGHLSRNYNSLPNISLSNYKEIEQEILEKEIENGEWGKRKGIKKEEIKTEAEEILFERIYFLKTLIHFLTLHSWGNCKRLFSLFESFVKYDEKNKPNLYLRTQDIQSLVLSSQLYILFHHNLSRLLMNVDDKLVVSSFSIFHYILKYHGIGFSREHILRMYETINIHSSPELIQVVDIIIHNVLFNHVRRVKNGFYQYRFTFLHEKEIHFITTINEGDSAAFNFSLNAMDAVKQHYKNLIIESKHTHADDRYGHGSLASIHVIVGNFHFWEQSFDEAAIHYGIALDMLRTRLVNANSAEKVDIYVQMIEIYLKHGSAEERVINYTAAAVAYLNAEALATHCLEIIRRQSKKDSEVTDVKWGILNQPTWAKLYLNLKLANTNVTSSLLKDDAVSKYKHAVLEFFKEQYDVAYQQFTEIPRCLENDENSEHNYHLKGNAYLKAALCLLLNFSSELSKDLGSVHLAQEPPGNKSSEIYSEESLVKKEFKATQDELSSFCKKIMPEIFRQIKRFKDIPELTNPEMRSEQNIPEKIGKTLDVQLVIRLLNLSALSFEKGKLYPETIISYLSMVMIWEAFLEMFPWVKYDGDPWKKEFVALTDHSNTQVRIVLFDWKEDNFISTALQKTFDLIGSKTGDAYHHSMKSVIERILRKNIQDYQFFESTKHKHKILNNKYALFQQYSLMGQVIAAVISWEEFAKESATGDLRSNVDIKLIKDSNLLILPFGIRYYSMMLWLRGRYHLTKLFKATCKRERNVCALNAIINLFRASQYVIKTHGETSNMILPPLFVVYYNMWEALVYLVEISLKELKKENNSNKNPLSFLSQAILEVRKELDLELRSDKTVRDVSSRMLDLSSVQKMAQQQFSIVERIGDLTSSDRLNVIKHKYYLDDDFEDNMFILDWTYCRFFAPGATLYSKMIEYKMKSLEAMCFVEENSIS